MNATEYVRSLPRNGWCLLHGKKIRHASEHACPLCYGTAYLNEEWEYAAKDIEMDYQDAGQIVMAADREYCCDKHLRRFMLKHFGLEEGK